MKKSLLIVLLSCLGFCAEAVHFQGGSITWKCNGSGNYVFQLKVYLDCAQLGSAPSSDIIEVYGHPTVSSIPVSLISSADVTPLNCGFSCSGPVTNYAIKEYIYESGSVNLGLSIPPVNGWIFHKTECCWGTNTNLFQGGSAYNNIIRSVMYSYNNQPATPCYNSSPAPAEKPVFNVCASNILNTHSLAAFEVDKDSVSYSFQSIVDGMPPSFTNVTYEPGYSATNPLPGSPSLQPTTGMLNFQPAGFMIGNFALGYRIDEYRCGVKISSVFPIQNYRIFNTCAAIFGGGANNSPEFVDPVTGTSISSLTDTIFPGDSVVLSVKINETDFNPSPISPQTVAMSGSGDYSIYGVRDSGCIEPPCAWFSRSLPYTFQAFDIIKFNWKTDCNILNSAVSCGNGFKSLRYSLRATDNYCPSPATIDLPIHIVIRNPYISVSADTLFFNGPSGSYQWYNDTVAIIGATNNWYLPTTSGNYSVQVTTSGGCSFFTAPRVINVNCNFNPTVTGTLMLCPNDTSSLTTQVYDSYQWYKRPIGGSAQMIPGATSQTLSINYFNDAGYYFSVEATDSGCTEMSPEVLVDGWVFLLPTVSSTGDFTIGPNGETIVCDGDTMYFTLLQPYDTNITWYESGNPIPGATSTVLTVSDAGFYTVQGAPSTCPNFIQNLGVTLEVQVITCGVGVDEVAAEGISIINPVTDYLKIISENKTGDFMLELVDVNGRIVFTGNGSFGVSTEFQLPEMDSGMYTCLLKTKNDLLLTKRVVVKRK